jgi:hypothetical protein
MTLKCIDNSGAAYEVKSVPGIEMYGRYKAKVREEVQDAVEAFIAEEIAKTTEFSLATQFPNPWPDELEPIYSFCNDELLAAYVLAGLVMENLIQAGEAWLYTKSNIQGRDFEANYYFRAKGNDNNT